MEKKETGPIAGTEGLKDNNYSNTVLPSAKLRLYLSTPSVGGRARRR